MVHSQARVDRGVPTGGQFAARGHQDPTITLGAPSGQPASLVDGAPAGVWEQLDTGGYLEAQTPENRHNLKMWTAAQEISEHTGVDLWDSLDYAEGFMQDFEPGTTEHDDFLAEISEKTWKVDLDTARTIDSRLREVHSADIDADDVHATGSPLFVSEDRFATV